MQTLPNIYREKCAMIIPFNHSFNPAGFKRTDCTIFSSRTYVYYFLAPSSLKLGLDSNKQVIAM